MYNYEYDDVIDVQLTSDLKQWWYVTLWEVLLFEKYHVCSFCPCTCFFLTGKFCSTIYHLSLVVTFFFHKQWCFVGIYSLWYRLRWTLLFRRCCMYIYHYDWSQQTDDLYFLSLVSLVWWGEVLFVSERFNWSL